MKLVFPCFAMTLRRWREPKSKPFSAIDGFWNTLSESASSTTFWYKSASKRLYRRRRELRLVTLATQVRARIRPATKHLNTSNMKKPHQWLSTNSQSRPAQMRCLVCPRSGLREALLPWPWLCVTRLILWCNIDPPRQSRLARAVPVAQLLQSRTRLQPNRSRYISVDRLRWRATQEWRATAACAHRLQAAAIGAPILLVPS